MRLESVNVGKIQIQPWRSGTPSGLHKHPVDGLIEVGMMGLAGDEQADTKNHGGADKAVFVMPMGNYARFNINRPFGFLGENLTISGVDETQISVGDHLQIGSVLLEVTQPRSPCWKLGEQAISLDSWDSASEFLNVYSDSGRVGFYCRVLQEGGVQKGHTLDWRPMNAEQAGGLFSIHDLYLARYYHRTEAHWSLLKKVVSHPALSVAWQTAIQTLLDNRK
ncbi:MAG: MOSC domain-containing protein [Thiotrichales bacterium]|nr:MOSC domain-containing protein [Thiotrichales bacterium]